jgi:hypothetical protein
MQEEDWRCARGSAWSHGAEQPHAFLLRDVLLLSSTPTSNILFVKLTLLPSSQHVTPFSYAHDIAAYFAATKMPEHPSHAAITSVNGIRFQLPVNLEFLEANSLAPSFVGEMLLVNFRALPLHHLQFAYKRLRCGR